MPLDQAELFIQWADVAGKEPELEAALRRLPGVTSVGVVRQDEDSVEARVRVQFDPEATNPVIIGDALDQAGFTVLSAGEEA